MFLPPLPAAPSLSDRFTRIIWDLCAVVAVHSARNRSLTPILVLLWSRLRRMAARFEKIAARVKAGTLSPPRAARPPFKLRTQQNPDKPRPPELPRGTGWLIKILKHEGAAYGSQLQYLLTDPEMVELLAKAPQAGRIFRPLCRLLLADPGPAARPPQPKPLAATAPPEVAARVPTAEPAPIEPPPAPPTQTARRPYAPSPEGSCTPASATGPPLPA